MHTSYAACLTASVAANDIVRDDAYIQQSQRKARQIHLRLTDKDEANKAKTQTQEQLLKRATVAMEFTESDNPSKPQDLCFLLASFQNRNRVVLELNTKESAMWMRQQLIFSSFLNHFQLKAEYSPTGYLIVIHNLPISFNITQGHINGAITYDNHLNADAIVSCRWINWSTAELLHSQQLTYCWALIMWRTPTHSYEGESRLPNTKHRQPNC